MLAAEHRLRRDQDIRIVVRQGRCVQNAQLRICVLPGKTQTWRVACVVGRRVSASAVTRHRLQRLLREAAAQTVPALSLWGAYDMVWVARPNLVQADNLVAMQKVVQPLIGSFARSHGFTPPPQ